MKKTIATIAAICVCLCAFATWNPSELATPGFRISGLSAEASVNHLASVLMDFGDTLEAIDEMPTGDLVEEAYELFKSFRGGYSGLLDASAGIGAQLGNWLVGFESDLALDCVADEIDPQVYNAYAVVRFDANAQVGYGFTLVGDEHASLDLGVVFRFGARAVSEKIGLAKALEITREDVDMARLFSCVGGNASAYLTADAGFTFTVLDGAVEMGCVFTGLGNGFKMPSYDSVDDIFASAPNGEEGADATPVTLDAYFRFNVVDIDAVDCDVTVGVSGIKSDSAVSDLIDVLDARVDANVMDIADIFVEMKGGYFKAGIGLGFMGSKIEAEYGWHEEGSMRGERPVDTFTVRCTLGYEK